jgi:hypothetical protein
MTNEELSLYQFQSYDGNWRSFLNEQHYIDVIADGSWPIRQLYIDPQIREWVGLNKHELDELDNLSGHELIRIIEAILRGKNT